MEAFENKVCVITGAGSGFGLEFARRAAALRMQDIVEQRNPSDPFSARPELAPK